MAKYYYQQRRHHNGGKDKVEVTSYAVPVNRSLNFVVNEQQRIQICAVSSDPNDNLDAQILVALTNPDQAEDVQVIFESTGEQVQFTEQGSFIFTPVLLNTCSNLLLTFKQPGQYTFDIALEEEVTNINLATNWETINVLAANNA
ncbi:hypothetical protein QTG56_14720 [Rossellomorea sp. AcN35-11]|nr:hypothetical protein [Rossellomorea aquimaris]NMH70365.1 hypothetical protein [Bacillus sp. RO3]WJV28349.1 hypothetical protein QTG56_14720 [Rossellomorea sp. AcN35-11]